MINLSSDINPLGPSDAVKAAADMGLRDHQVPDPFAADLSKELVRAFPVWADNVMCGHSPLALMSIALRVLNPRRALIVEPCSLAYRRMLNLAGIQIHTVPLEEAKEFAFEPFRIVNALQGIDVLIMGNPTSPTGSALAHEQLRFVADEARRRRAFVIFDETYVDWTPSQSMASEVKDNGFFLVLRSLDKFYALPGLDAAYAVGARKLIAKMKQFQEICSCSEMAQRLALAALRDSEYREESLAWFREERECFSREVNESGVFKCFPSSTLFHLLKVRSPYAAIQLFDSLARSGVRLEPLNGHATLGSGYARVSIRQRNETEQFLQQVRSWQAAQKSAGTMNAKQSKISRDVSPEVRL